VVVFVLAAAVKYAAVAVLLAFEAPGWLLHGQDILVSGALSAAFAFALLMAFASRRRHMNEQIRLAATLNHEVRNALEVILGSDYLPKSEQSRAVMESVDRINRTLNGILQPNDRVVRIDSR
jgi:signal transduction histidine kinase